MERISKKSIEKKAKCIGLDITVGNSWDWIGSRGKGKYAYSRYVPGRGIVEPVDGFATLRELEESIDCI